MAWNIMKCIILHVVTGQVNVHYIQEHFSRQKLWLKEKDGTDNQLNNTQTQVARHV